MAAASNNTAELLRVAARELFYQHGYSGASMRKLALATGIQPGSLYHYIDSKQSLLFDIIDEYEHAFFSLINERKRARRRSNIVQDTLIERSVHFIEVNHAAALVTKREIHHLSPAQQKHIAELRERRLQYLDDSLRQGNAGLTAADARQKAMIIMTSSIPMLRQFRQAVSFPATY